MFAVLLEHKQDWNNKQNVERQLGGCERFCWRHIEQLSLRGGSLVSNVGWEI